MNVPSYHIAVRFLLAHKRSMGLSTLGVALGVALFIAALAQTQGFEQFYIRTLLGVEGSIVIADRFQNLHTRIIADKPDQEVMVANQQQRKYYPGIADAYRIIDVLQRIPGVLACSPIVEGHAFIRSGFSSDAISLMGINLEQHLRATNFAKQIKKGSLDDFRNNPSGIAVGTMLAERMRLDVGQSVYVVGPGNETRRYRIDVIYESGVWAFDIKNVFVHTRSAQTLLQKPYFTSFMIVKLADPMRATPVAREFEDLLSHGAASWQNRQRGNLQIFQLIRISAAIVVSMVILLSGFGIFNVLSISVMQRSKEIAILRSMGYRRSDIAWIFLWQGFWVGLIAVLGGWGLGAAMTYGISKIPVNISGVLRTSHFLVEWSVIHYLVAGALAFVAVLAASYVPACAPLVSNPLPSCGGLGNDKVLSFKIKLNSDTTGGGLVFQEPLVGGADAFAQGDFRLPAQGQQAAGIQQFAGSSVGLALVPDNLTLKLCDPVDDLRQFGDANFLARADVDDFR
ncbi:MAG: ABC transporter permease [Blastochloris sp.]|nr:ABC transporter permease [Blastochloris sp.]